MSILGGISKGGHKVPLLPLNKLRRTSQGLFLLIFLILFFETESKGRDELGYPVKVFLDFDPLIFLVTLLSNHSIIKNLFLLSMITVALTLVLGRVFCGWVCPLGTINSMVGFRTERRWRDWHRVKYYILIFMLASSVFTLQIAGLLDPISLLIRSLSIGINPSFNSIIRSFFDTLYHIEGPLITDLTEGIYTLLKKTVLSFEQPVFRQEIFIAFIFIGILTLNLLERRFWCNSLCPLGAFLGIISRFALLKRFVSVDCTECGSCDRTCHGRAAPDKKGLWRQVECLYCFNCERVCPEDAVSFSLRGKKEGAGLDLSRRRFIISAVSGAIAVPFIRLDMIKRNPNPILIRPPGALSEEEFIKRCVKCGECMKVCITNGLQPTLFEAGLEGLWTPILVPGLGYCEYRCTLCGQVCPTGAIKRLSLEEKVKVKIGLAFINKDRCLPYAHGRECIVCEEVCPTPEKAIWFEEAEVKEKNGGVKKLKQPKVDLELCIGCGICETKCPVIDRPAIYVTSIGESRSKDNQLFLIK
ncbi:MAG: 4Fe-4S binding protein [Nitrospirae bacterium]|nr:4Fe-4S binding protein [Nitrospirota bacterium]